MNDAIKTAIALVGTQRKLGVECGLSQQAVNKWLHNKAKVSPEYVHLIIKATKGMVKGYQIRPDLPELFPPSGTDSLTSSTRSVTIGIPPYVAEKRA